MRYIDRDEIARRLTYEVCIPIIRDAMVAFSSGETKQLLRSIIPLSDGRMFGIMPGALGAKAPFGAKLISVFHENFAKGIQSHQGVVVLFGSGKWRAGMHCSCRGDHGHPHRRGERRRNRGIGAQRRAATRASRLR